MINEYSRNHKLIEGAPAWWTAKQYINQAYQTITAVEQDIYTNGYDMSQWNVGVSHDEMKLAGYEFAWVKATQGVSWLDPKFNETWPRLVDAGIIPGAYHFMTRDRGANQADWFLEKTRLFREQTKDFGRLPDAGDVEDLTISALVGPGIVSDWHSAVASVSKKERPGLPYQTAIYSTAYHWKQITNNMPLPSGAAGWPAHWTPLQKPYTPVGWPVSAIMAWQYCIANYHAWAPEIPYTKRLDLNRFYGSKNELLAFSGANGDPDPEPPVNLKFVVLQDGLRVRNHPSTLGGSIISTVNSGNVYEVFNVGGNDSWVYVQYEPGKFGWVNVQLRGDVNMKKVE